ncbi:MAG: tetratricopeptide repeat protein [Pseudomonadota bacterium]
MARTPTDKDNPEQELEAPSREDEILMREIDEAVRQDDAKEFFEKYGVALVSAISLLLAGMFGYWWYDSTNEAKLEGQSEQIISALDSVDAGDFVGVEEKTAPLIEDGSDGARTVARMIQAAAALEQGDNAKATEIYTAIIADDQAPQPLRDLALIREVSINFDESEPADVIAKLETLAVPGNPFFGSAGELTAIAHLESGNRDAAGTLFGELAQDEQVPETLRERARQMAGLLGVDAIEDVDELLEGIGTAPQGATGP